MEWVLEISTYAEMSISGMLVVTNNLMTYDGIPSLQRCVEVMNETVQSFSAEELIHVTQMVCYSTY